MSEESKVVVGVATSLVPGGPPTVMLGMTPHAWDKIADGKTHTFDMRKAGINAQIVIFRGETHAEVIETLRSGAEMLGAPFDDHRGKGPLPDLGIDEPTKQ